jgi:hypothetical protein
MRGMGRISGILVVLLAALFPLVPKGAGAESAAPSGSARNLSSVAAADGFLRAQGIDPSTAIHQLGARNYAGPSCPGAGWNCTSSSGRAVVQMAGSDGVNEYECTPHSGGSQASDSCVVVQMATRGLNDATCQEEVSGTAPDASCSITQHNNKGDNEVDVDQEWQQQKGSTQSASQSAVVTQVNNRGHNSASVDQDISQLIENSAASQDQEAVQVACVQQDSQSGGNHAEVEQQVTQSEEESASNTTQYQNQNAGPDTTCGASSTTISPNLAAIVLQDENTPSAGGRDSERVRQHLKQTQTSLPDSGSVYQQQGNNFDSGGLEAIPNQDTTGLATATTGQFENQLQDSETPRHSRTQIQNDPIHNPCCEGVQSSNPSDTFQLTQKGVQHADRGATQLYDMQGDCDSSGTCTVKQTFVTNTASNTETCSPGPCSVFSNNEE